MRSCSCFGKLPDDVLRRIETFLGVKDRLAFFSCWAMRAYQTAASGGLWPELEFNLSTLEQMLAFGAWLEGNRQHLGELTLRANCQTLKAMCCLNMVLDKLAGSSVHTLGLDVDMGGQRPNMGGWLLDLPQLKSLEVEANQLASLLPDDLSHLARLTYLSLAGPGWGSGQPLASPPSVMPPQLRELYLQRFNAGAFGKCAMASGALQHLQGLTLWVPSSDWAVVLPWGWLPLRTALTSLELYSWNHMRALPAQLAALTGLRQLSFQHCELPGTDEALEPLSALVALTSLDLSYNCLRDIPALVFALPSLQELDARYNYFGMQEQDIPLAGSTSLTKLFIDADLALREAERLVRFPALRTLELYSDEYLFSGEEAHATVGQLLGKLKLLPRFQVLDVTEVEHVAFRRLLELLQVLNLEYPYEILDY